MSGILNALAGSGGPEVYLQTFTASYQDSVGGDAAFRVDTDGLMYATGGGANLNSIFTWLRRGSAGDFSVRVTKTGGANSFSTAAYGDGVWGAINGDKSWTLASGASGLKEVIFTIEIARTSNTGVILASATNCNINAERII